MVRPLRFIPENSVVEVTTRTIQSRLLLRPSAELNELILGIIGRALQLCKVKLHAFIVMSNHVHLLLSPENAEELANFMRHVNRNISVEVGRLHGWKGPLWDRRYRAIVVADDEAQVARLRYILSNGCKEGLVGSPLDWPGATCAHALLDKTGLGNGLAGVWVDRSAMYRDRRTGKLRERAAYQTRYNVPLAPLPCWARLSAAKVRKRCARLVADIERETAALNAESGREPMGAAWVSAQDPHGMPASTSKSPAPMVHATSKKTRKAFWAAYTYFVDAYRRAADLLRQGCFDIAFPVGSFPPARPFVHPT